MTMTKQLIHCIRRVTVASAQPVVAPTNEPLGTARGENVGSYNVTNSFETGYRLPPLAATTRNTAAM